MLKNNNENQSPVPIAQQICVLKGTRNGDPHILNGDFDTMTAEHENTQGLTLCSKNNVVVFYSADVQTARVLNPFDLQGVLILCCVNDDGEPTSITSYKLIKKFAKVFDKPKTPKSATPNPEQLSLQGSAREED